MSKLRVSPSWRISGIIGACDTRIRTSEIDHVSLGSGYCSDSELDCRTSSKLKAWSERPTQLDWFWKCSEFLNWTQLFEVRRSQSSWVWVGLDDLITALNAAHYLSYKHIRTVNAHPTCSKYKLQPGLMWIILDSAKNVFSGVARGVRAVRASPGGTCYGRQTGETCI